MSYRITMDGEAFCASTVEHSAVLNPVVNLEANKAGSLTFTILPDHPHYNDIVLRSSVFDVWQNGKLIFSGVPIQESLDFWNRKTITCEGELGYLNDTIQRQAVYQQQTVSSLLGAYLTAHNAQADASKQFQLGAVTVDGGSQIFRYTNYNTTMTEISEDLVDNFGGFLRVRHEDGVRLLDYLASSPHTSSQIIRIGQNLVDLSRNLSSLDICTVLIPLGANTGNQLIDGLDERVTIESVNEGKDYIIGTAVATYGHIWRTHTWDDVTTPTALLAKGQEYLSDVQYADLVIEASALDLGLADEDVEQFQLLDMIRVVSDPHGLDRYFLLSKLQINLDHPAETKITLGINENYALTTRAAQNSMEIQKQNTSIMVNASENARRILEAATFGSIQMLYNEDGVVYEMRINNSSNPDTATAYWRYNAGGWGYFDGENYVTAATMDGTIFATLIKAGILSSDNGKFYVNLDTGAAELKDVSITGGSMTITGLSTTDARVNITYTMIDVYGYERTYSSILKPAMLTNQMTIVAGGQTTTDYANLRFDGLIFGTGNSDDTGYQRREMVIYSGTGSQRVLIDATGVYFYNSAGQLTKTYSATQERR